MLHHLETRNLSDRNIVPLLTIIIGLSLLLIWLVWSPAPGSSFPETWNLHLRDTIDGFHQWIVRNRVSHPIFIWFFDPLSQAIDIGIRTLEDWLLWIPWPVLLAGVFLLGHRAGGLRLALVAMASLFFMGLVGLWQESLQTLALMGVAVLISLLIGLPVGILAARYPKFEAVLRPLLDAMQTMPAFVYLIPVLLFFGIARVPSVVATVIYALPPAIRLTSLGIRQVPATTVEAARSFGATRNQILYQVQLPLALPTIMAGVNQTIMMALSIVVIAALIGAGGLGQEVLVALQRLRVGQALEAGLAIVALAVILDRISYAFSQTKPATTLNHPFRLLPARLDRFAPAIAFERGLERIDCLGDWLTRTVVGGLLALLRLINRQWADTVSPLLERQAFWLIFGLSLGLLLIITKYLFNLTDFPASLTLSMRQPADDAIRWIRDNFYQIGDLPLGTGPLSDFIVIYALNPIRDFLLWLPWPLLILGMGGLAYWLANWRLALLTMLGVLSLGLLGMWEHSLNTLSQVIVAVFFAVLIAVPVGIWAARNDTFEIMLRPVLDLLQTIPVFVYLVPVIMLFNVGRVPGIIASVLYALPPAIRLTNLGIRQVNRHVLEAAHSFGATPRQKLWGIQLPLALPSIMLGINQTVMMVLAMVIIAGLVGGGGLGLEAVNGLTRNETGRGFEAGFAIVIIAMIMDRLTQALAKKQRFQ